jgi:hypothetical protein
MKGENPTVGFDAVSSVLIRCFFMVFAFVLFWFLLFVLGGNWAYRLHSVWFPLTYHEYVLVNYCGIAIAKICNIIFFLFPYIAIRRVSKGRKTV